MTMMIDHHAMAVHMSEVCLEKAVHGELRALCGEMKAAQTSEIQTMQSWLQDWYGVSHTPEMKDGGQMAKLMSLKGEEFDIAFMKTMVRHHRTAVKEGLKCVEKAEHREPDRPVRGDGRRPAARDPADGELALPVVWRVVLPVGAIGVRVAKDPLCGMQVDERSAAAQAGHQGKRYYFCSAGCPKKVQTDDRR